jgi:GT2 family glycosyltransferase
MKQALPRVSIIVPTWNGRRYIDNCLNSLLRQAYPSLEVIVVDNASTDGTPQVIAEHFPTVKLIHNDRNLGFSGGVNVGLRTAEGDALIFFNQDAAAEPEWLRLLISGLYAAPDIGVVGCRILNLEDQTIQHAAGYLNLPRALPASLNVDQSETDQDCQPVDVEFVTGAAFGLHRRVFEAIGGLDDIFSSTLRTWTIATGLELLVFESCTYPLRLCATMVMPAWGQARSVITPIFTPVGFCSS